jgi:hypothetical protein
MVDSAAITCVFPAFSAGQIGGVQESARMASNAITRAFTDPEILEYDSAAVAGRLAFVIRGVSKPRRVAQYCFGTSTFSRPSHSSESEKPE